MTVSPVSACFRPDSCKCANKSPDSDTDKNPYDIWKEPMTVEYKRMNDKSTDKETKFKPYEA